MILEVYTVHDRAVGAFLQPFFVRSRGEAVRSFTEACNDGKSQFAKYPGDYTMYFVGKYDDQSGMFLADGSPSRVIGAIEVHVVDSVAERSAEDRRTFAA